MTTIDIIASVALILGALMSLLAGIAVLRFPDTMSRIHAATKPQVLGIILLMLGVGLRIGSPGVIGMLVLIVILQFVTAPVSAHLTVRAAYRHSVDDHSVEDHSVDDEVEADESAAFTEKRRAEKDRGQPGSAG